MSRLPASLRVGDELLEEERVASGRLDHLRPQLRLGAGGKLLGLLVGKRPELDRAVGQRRTCLEQLGAAEAEAEDRTLRVRGEVLDQVEQRRLGPVHVVEDEDERPLPGQPLEDAARLEEDLAGRCSAGQDRVQPLARLLEHLRKRQPRGALAVGDAAADEHRRLVADAHDELARQARLADPGLADDRHQPAAALGAGLVVGSPQRCQLPLAPDERRVERAGDRAGSFDDRQQLSRAGAGLGRRPRRHSAVALPRRATRRRAPRRAGDASRVPRHRR